MAKIVALNGTHDEAYDGAAKEQEDSSVKDADALRQEMEPLVLVTVAVWQLATPVVYDNIFQ